MADSPTKFLYDLLLPTFGMAIVETDSYQFNATGSHQYWTMPAERSGLGLIVEAWAWYPGGDFAQKMRSASFTFPSPIGPGADHDAVLYGSTVEVNVGTKAPGKTGGWPDGHDGGDGIAPGGDGTGGDGSTSCGFTLAGHEELLVCAGAGGGPSGAPSGAGRSSADTFDTGPAHDQIRQHYMRGMDGDFTEHPGWGGNQYEATHEIGVWATGFPGWDGYGSADLDPFGNPVPAYRTCYGGRGGDSESIGGAEGVGGGGGGGGVHGGGGGGGSGVPDYVTAKNVPVTPYTPPDDHPDWYPMDSFGWGGGGRGSSLGTQGGAGLFASPSPDANGALIIYAMWIGLLGGWHVGRIGWGNAWG